MFHMLYAFQPKDKYGISYATDWADIDGNFYHLDQPDHLLLRIKAAERIEKIFTNRGYNGWLQFRHS